MEKENTCPKCGAEMTRDEHPELPIASPWSCNYCGYSEEREIEEPTKKELDQLPF